MLVRNYARDLPSPDSCYTRELARFSVSRQRTSLKGSGGPWSSLTRTCGWSTAPATTPALSVWWLQTRAPSTLEVSTRKGRLGRQVRVWQGAGQSGAWSSTPNSVFVASFPGLHFTCSTKSGVGSKALVLERKILHELVLLYLCR